MNILQNIFINHYEELIYLTHPRPSVVENVDKMINCGDPSFGGAMYAIDRTTSMSFKLINCSHRHCVFTIPEELRNFFLEDRTLLNCLFSSVRSVVLRMFHKENKSELFTPGFICVLHTFGRSLQWNPHIHCLISEGGIGNSSSWRTFKHFNYTFLRNAFCTALLNELEDKIGSSFKAVKAYIYKNCIEGFYIYAKPALCRPREVTKYIGRYLGRPVIATKHIDKNDGKNVTFHYNRHEDDELVVETVTALEFMQLLVQHIPEKHFKMIRYYGIYARHRKQDSKLYRAIPKEKHRILLSFNKWRNAILSSFGYDPLECLCCKNTMSVLEIYYKHKRVSLQELYERTRSKHSIRPPA